MTARVRNVSRIAGAFAVIALLAYAIARGPIERSLFLSAVARQTGLVLDADRVERDGDAYVVAGLRAHSRGGAVIIEAAHARIERGSDALSVVLDRPRLTFAPDRYRGDEVEASRAAQSADGTLALDVRDATLTVVSGDVPVPLLRFDTISGTLHVEQGEPRYAVTGSVVDGDARYPIAARSSTGPGGDLTHDWSAPLLPIHPFVALVTPDAATRPIAGWLHDTDVRVGSSLHATVRLEDVAVALGSHALSGVHGTLDFEGDGVGSRSLVGRLDAAIPFEAAGEVHDLPSHGAWLRDGSNDLRALARLIEDVSAEPQLRSARIEATAPGLAFAQYGIQTDHGPLAISVLSIDPHEPTLRFDTALAEDHVISGGERTSAMGVRTGAVAGVNGDYFDIGRTYQPQGMLVKGGKLMRGPTDRAAMSIDRFNNVTFSEFHIRGTVSTKHGSMPITEFNDWPPGYVSVITPDYGRTLRGTGSATFVALEPEGSHAGRYRVTNVIPAGGAPDVSFGIAIGARVHVPLPKVGDMLGLSYATEPATGGAVAAIGGGPILLRDGAWFEDPHAPAPDERNYRWPVVALARQHGGRLLLVAVDGRHPERSVGATRPEFAAILQRLGASDAMALDSGGSVTMVSRAPGDANVSVRNVPSDNSAERWISDGLFLY
ncbi:MAG: phosphodiester glycosidase family protein, partial [Candidatus Eremiobacteraeota bacterium]|nr:phosphodiester glycosidase family protein [Candidatus Eremiobacteraeota bacterium]